MKWLKADLHLHSNDDPKETHLGHNRKQLIEFMAKSGFDVISITHHDSFGYTKELAEYAKKRGILLLPGIEKRIEGKEVLLYNVYPNELKRIKKLSDLTKIKRKDTLIVAPHPFYVLPQCLNSRLIKHIDSFDAIEHCVLYTRFWNRNKRAIQVARRYNKTLIANSDGHQRDFIGTNYSLIDSKKDMISIFDAIKRDRLKMKTRPLSIFELIKLNLAILISYFSRSLPSK